MAHHQAAHAHRTADDEYLPVEGSSYEHTDANVWAIAKFGLWLAITALIVHVGIGLLYSLLVEQAKDTTEQRYPLAAGTGPKLPPEPRLQQFPRTEIYELRLSERQKLTEYGWVDKEAGVVRIPIDAAMRLTIERLPARTQDAENPPPSPGMLASDASAGRLMERRRQ